MISPLPSPPARSPSHALSRLILRCLAVSLLLASGRTQAAADTLGRAIREAQAAERALAGRP